MKKMSLNVLWTVIGILIAAMGISFTIKADVGTGSVNALSLVTSWKTGIHVGTVLMCVNMLFILIQLIGQKFHIKFVLQAMLSVMLGVVVNFFVYTIFGQITVNQYPLRLLLYLSGTTISCFGIGILVRLNLVVFPPEAASLYLAQKFNTTFKAVRQKIDFVCILLALLASFVFTLPLTVREGTVMNFFLLPILGQFFIHFIEKQGWFESIRID